MKLEKVKDTVVTKYLKQLHLSTGGTAAERLERLKDSQLALHVDKLTDCDVCNGRSSEDLDMCPYCGSSDSEAPSPTTTNSPEESEPDMATKKSEKPAPKAKAAKKETNPKTDKAAAKKSDKPAPKANPAAAIVKASDAKPGNAAKPAKAPKTEVLTVKMLDGEIRTIGEHQRAGASSLYEVGKHLRIIESRGLYSLRLGADGKPLYKTFGAFVEAELDFDKKYAQRIIDVVQRFSVGDVRKIGVSKLSLLASIKPGEEFDALLDQARGGATRPQIEEEIRRLQPVRELPTRGNWKGDETNRGQRRAPQQSEPIAAPEQSDTITVIVSQGETELVLKREKSSGAMVAQEKSANGVKIRYQVSEVEQDGVMVQLLTITRSR